MSAKLTIRGLAELYAELKKLPTDLQGEGGQLVIAAANSAATAIRSNYGTHRHTGHLQAHVEVVEHSFNRGLGAAAVVKSRSPHAFIFEKGSGPRTTSVHRLRPVPSGRGGFRGRMWGKQPNPHAFIPIAVRERARLTQQLADLVRRHGLQVSGGA